ncbi:MAG TPA: 50S ribosomal protein L29, partial [Burkholderiaceae bacterium]|nr:50S ribosomal protein L29 [Burkholderiaceae bacterium]
RTKDEGALKQELEALLKAQFGLRMQKATQQLGNSSQLQKVRRDIARVKTVMREKAAK